MNPQEIEKKIEKMIRVTPQQVTMAKIFLSKNFYSSPVQGIEKLLEAMQVPTPEEICVHQSVDTDAMVKQAAEAISWKLAGCEAVWGLISSNVSHPGHGEVHGSRSEPWVYHWHKRKRPTYWWFVPQPLNLSRSMDGETPFFQFHTGPTIERPGPISSGIGNTEPS